MVLIYFADPYYNCITLLVPSNYSNAVLFLHLLSLMWVWVNKKKCKKRNCQFNCRVMSVLKKGHGVESRTE